MNEREPLLQIKGLKKHFNLSTLGNKRILTAVDGIDLDIDAGETFGLVGESGCGKTTTGRLVVNLYRPTDGNILFKGKSITQVQTNPRNKNGKPKFRKLSKRELFPYRRKIQIIFQDPYASLNTRMTISEIIGEGIYTHDLVPRDPFSLVMHKKMGSVVGGLNAILKGFDNMVNGVLKGISWVLRRKEPLHTKKPLSIKWKKKVYQEDKIQERVMDLLEKVGLKREHASRYPHEFSGGQRQRIGIARALALEPEMIVCDEPISALDVSIQAQVINLLEDLQKDFGLTYLFIAHDLSMVRHISNRIGVMYLGKLMEVGEADDLYEHPLHPYTMSLLSAIPIPDPHTSAWQNRVILEGDVASPINPKPGCRFASRCRYAEDICTKETPELRDIKGRKVACHLVEEIQKGLNINKDA